MAEITWDTGSWNGYTVGTDSALLKVASACNADTNSCAFLGPTALGVTLDSDVMFVIGLVGTGSIYDKITAGSFFNGFEVKQPLTGVQEKT